jgi:hypothetical protein
MSARVEPDVGGLFSRKIREDTVFENFCNCRHSADLFVAHLVVPLDHRATGLLLRFLRNPFGNGCIIRTSGDEFLKSRVFESRNQSHTSRQRAAGMVFAICPAATARRTCPRNVRQRHNRR